MMGLVVPERPTVWRVEALSLGFRRGRKLQNGFIHSTNDSINYACVMKAQLKTGHRDSGKLLCWGTNTSMSQERDLS